MREKDAVNIFWLLYTIVYMSERSPSRTQQEQHKEAAPPPVLQGLLLDSIADRYKAEGGVPELLPTVSPEEFEKLTEEERTRAEKNAHVLRLLNGHKGQDLRTIAVHGKSPEAQHLSYLLSWSKDAAEQHAIDLTGLLSETPPSSLEIELDSEQLYERLMLFEKYPDIDRAQFAQEQAKKTAEALGISGDNVLWNDMTDVTFPEEPDAEKVESLLRSVGTIPTELMDRKRFRGIRAQRVVGLLNTLVQIEDSQEATMKSALTGVSRDKKYRREYLADAASARELMEQARHERAKVLNYFFIGRNAEQLRRRNVKNITLDSNGLFIQVRGFQSHIPYGLVSSEMLTVLGEHGWIDEMSQHEITVRTAEENTDLGKERKESGMQLMHFAEALHTKGAPEEVAVRFARQALENPEEFAKVLAQNNLLIPDSIIASLRERGREGISALMRIAEAIGAGITSEELSNETGGFSSYDLLHRSEGAYAARARVLNHPDYYNVTKITRHTLPAIPASNSAEEFLAFRGRYKKNRAGDDHSFIETVHKGVVARVLVNEDKHLHGLRKEYGKLPLFERQKYTELEGALQSYAYFKSQVDILRPAKNFRDEHGNTEYRKMYQAIESCRQFLLNNVTKYYRDAEDGWERYYHAVNEHKESGESQDELQKLVALFDEADRTYAHFLYNSVGTETSLIETFTPDVEKKEVQFGPSFLHEAKEHCASDGFDPQLCGTYEGSTRLLQIHHKIGDPSKTIPFHIEEEVLQHLPVSRGKPLINVIGGARKLGDDLEKFTEAIVRGAHEHQANVGVSGTQSGIGLMFGKEYLKYQEVTDHLSDREKAHIFAINPGGNTFYPGNPYLKDTPQNEIFAASPVPQVVTPFQAGWELTGNEKFDSPYRLHVAYMEALYRRMSNPNERLMVVGNGGLYSLFEINASIDNDFKLFLVRGTGRFADVASLFSSRLYSSDLNPRVLSDEEFARKIIQRVQSRRPEDVAQEFLKKDFGFNEVPENEDYAVYRHFFKEYMTRVTKGYYTEIRSVDLEHLEEMLKDFFTPSAKNYRATRLPYEEI